MSYFSVKFIFLVLFVVLVIVPRNNATSNGGQWQYLIKSIGIPALHMQLLNNDRVIIFDRTDFGPSNITLPSSECQIGRRRSDCSAHSVEYDVLTNSVRPLNIITDTWCSSGVTLSDGTLLQSGGYGHGDQVIREFLPCSTCDWKELQDQLFVKRWYATNHILPDGTTIIIGGTMQPNYEFFPRTKLFDLPFLTQAKGRMGEDNLYPFVFLNVDGNLFIFANNFAILFDYKANKVVRTYPVVPGGDPRNYPSTGSAVLLPLTDLELGPKIDAEVLICGGTPAISKWLATRKSQFIPALNTCARIKINDPNATWAMENMPMSRTMSDMVLLPNGNVLIINGGGSGCAGWELGRDPILTPLMYNPTSTLGSRFDLMSNTTIPRMYHSTAILLRDGRVLVGGSNPHKFDNFTNVLFPTELSLEAYSPPYLDPSNATQRPTIVTPTQNFKLAYNTSLVIRFFIKGHFNMDYMKFTMIRPPFNTHSFSMSQRLLVLTKTTPVKNAGRGSYQIHVNTPGSAVIAPPGFYMLFAVYQDVPSAGVWVQIF